MTEQYSNVPVNQKAFIKMISKLINVHITDKCLCNRLSQKKN